MFLHHAVTLRAHMSCSCSWRTVPIILRKNTRVRSTVAVITPYTSAIAGSGGMLLSGGESDGEANSPRGPVSAALPRSALKRSRDTQNAVDEEKKLPGSGKSPIKRRRKDKEIPAESGATTTCSPSQATKDCPWTV